MKLGTASETVAESATADGAERAPAMGTADSALAKAIAELQARPTGEERIAEAVRLMVEQRNKLHIANTANGEKTFMMLFR